MNIVPRNLEQLPDVGSACLRIHHQVLFAITTPTPVKHCTMFAAANSALREATNESGAREMVLAAAS